MILMQSDGLRQKSLVILLSSGALAAIASAPASALTASGDAASSPASVTYTVEHDASITAHEATAAPRLLAATATDTGAVRIAHDVDPALLFYSLIGRELPATLRANSAKAPGKREVETQGAFENRYISMPKRSETPAWYEIPVIEYQGPYGMITTPIEERPQPKFDQTGASGGWGDSVARGMATDARRGSR